MRKNLALTVLWAVMSLTGSFDLDASLFDDTDDDASVECVEFHRDAGENSRVLSAASQAAGEPIDSAWVARDAHGHAAAAAVQRPSPHVAMVNVTVDGLRDQPARIATPAINRALDYCREAGALKVTIRAAELPAPLVIALAEGRGYQFSPRGGAGEAQTLEFYTDLYWYPQDAQRA